MATNVRPNIPALILSYGRNEVPRAWVRDQMIDRGSRHYGLSQWAKRSANGSGGNVNITSKRFGNALYELDHAGLIRRTETTIVILNRLALAQRANVPVD